MAKGLRVSEDLLLPLDAVTSTSVVYGGKGMGKTNFGSVLVEELDAAKMRFSVIDPMGVWWGIRHAADGVGKGVECLLLGGVHGDIPIEPTGGAVIADLVADESVSCVIDISRTAEGQMWSIAQRMRFMTDFGKQLYMRQGSLVNKQRRPPLCVVVDEAARFIPQTIRAGNADAAMCESVWATLVEEGRNVGLGVVLLTQRSARLNKDVAELADVMLAFRTVGPNSIGAVVDWLGEHVPKERIREMVAQVRSLPVGSCLAVSPGWLGLEKVAAIRKRRTFDSSATPKAGQKAARVRGDGAKPNLALYAERMKETIERAKADSPKELKEQIRKLKEELAKKPAATKSVATVTVKAEVDPKLTQQIRELSGKVKDRQLKAEKLATFIERTMRPVMEKLNEVLIEFRSESALAAAVPAAIVKAPEHSFPSHRIVPTRQAHFNTASKSAGDGKALTGKALMMAQIVAGYGERGEGIDRQLLATLCGMSLSGGGFGARLSEARSAGALVTEGGEVRATQEGIAQYAGQFQAPSTTAEVLALWRPRLSGKALAMFDHLVSLRGESTTRPELAAAIGMEMSGGGFGARLSEVRSTQLLEEGGGRVAVNKRLLFL